MIPFLLLGVFGGVYGAYFSKLNYRWSRDVRNKTWMKTHPVAEVLLVSLSLVARRVRIAVAHALQITSVTTVLCFLNPYTRMGGTELVYNLFAECRTGSANTHSGLCVLGPGTPVWPIVRAIATALVVKAALTVVTFGIKVPAGIFIPTLGVGACAGRIMGIGVQWAQWRWPGAAVFAVCGGNLDCVIPGLYAMVGAAAALSGVTRTTVSLAVIMFELTDTLTYAVPVMLSVLVAKTVADALEPKGIYDLVIECVRSALVDFSGGLMRFACMQSRAAAVPRREARVPLGRPADQRRGARGLFFRVLRRAGLFLTCRVLIPRVSSRRWTATWT